MKSRLTSIDVRATIVQLRDLLLGLRLSNIYDVSFSRRIYLLKFARGEQKHHVVVESGTRIHTTLWKRDKNTIPSAFAMKLRKHLRSRRLEALNQLGVDRVIDFVFGVGQNATHLIIELYVAGNIVLTDANHVILIVLRPHSNVADCGRIAVGQEYVPPPPESFLCKSPQLLMAAHQLLLDTASTTATPETFSNTLQQMPVLLDDIEGCIRRRLEELQQREDAKQLQQQNELQQQRSKRKGERKQKVGLQLVASGKFVSLSFRDALASVLPFAHPALLTHALVKAAKTIRPLDQSIKIDTRPLQLDETHRLEDLTLLCGAALECFRILIGLSTQSDYLGSLISHESSSFSLFDWIPPLRTGWGLIERIESVVVAAPHGPLDCAFGRRAETGAAEEEKGLGSTVEDPSTRLPESTVEIYGDFSPALLISYEDASPEKIRKFDSFLQCMDTVFSNQERVNQSKQEKQITDQKLSRSENIKLDQRRRVDQLVDEQQKAEKYAELIEANLDLVQQSIAMLQAAIATGVGWRELWNHIKLEKRNNHPIATIVHSLDLGQQRAHLLLEPTKADVLEEDLEMLPVPIDLDVSAYGNIERLHFGRKQMKQKVERTEVATKEALAKALLRKKSQAVRKARQQAGGIAKMRKHFWFEKFNWFITSENYLVLAGRDAQQNDMLFKRYFEKNDLYVHADVHGAASCIIKNPTSEPIPPITLSETGRMSVCRSAAWDTKLIASAWWVYRDQVSKSAPTGEYLVSGAFIIRGRKNFLPPWKLEMGLGILFHLGEDSISAHRGERGRKTRADDVEENDQKTGKGLEGPQREDAYSVAFPSEALRQRIEAELADENVRQAQEEEEKQQKRFEKKHRRVQQLEGGEGGGGAQARDKERPEVESQRGKTQQQAATTQPHHFPRGKRSKIKRLKEKYKEQEPEERKLRMALLGAAEMKDVDSFTGEVHFKREAELPSLGSTPSSPEPNETTAPPHDSGTLHTERREQLLNGKLLQDSKNGKLPVDAAEESEGEGKGGEEEIIEQDDEDAVGGERSSDDEGESAKEKDFGIAEEPKVPEVDDAETVLKRLSELECLTSTPLPNDSLLSVVPVCAPWSTLQSYKYKIKLVPGNMKKGKAGQQCLKLLAQQATNPIERQLITSIDMNDLGNALVSNSKISMPGLQQLQNVERAARKQMKKAIHRHQDDETVE